MSSHAVSYGHTLASLLLIKLPYHKHIIPSVFHLVHKSRTACDGPNFLLFGFSFSFYCFIVLFLNALGSAFLCNLLKIFVPCGVVFHGLQIRRRREYSGIADCYCHDSLNSYFTLIHVVSSSMNEVCECKLLAADRNTLRSTHRGWRLEPGEHLVRTWQRLRCQRRTVYRAGGHDEGGHSCRGGARNGLISSAARPQFCRQKCRRYLKGENCTRNACKHHY